MTTTEPDGEDTSRVTEEQRRQLKDLFANELREAAQEDQ